MEQTKSLSTTAGRVEIPAEVWDRLPAPSMSDVALLWSRLVPLPDVGGYVPMDDGSAVMVTAVMEDVPVCREPGERARATRHIVIATTRSVPVDEGGRMDGGVHVAFIVPMVGHASSSALCTCGAPPGKKGWIVDQDCRVHGMRA